MSELFSWNKMFCADFLNTLCVFVHVYINYIHLIINPSKNIVWDRLLIFKDEPADQTTLNLNINKRKETRQISGL